MPETKGKSLEEIQRAFQSKSKRANTPELGVLRSA